MSPLVKEFLPILSGNFFSSLFWVTWVVGPLAQSSQVLSLAFILQANVKIMHGLVIAFFVLFYWRILRSTFPWSFIFCYFHLINRVRFHYGHPDVFDRIFHITRGGISKASKTINLSEDVFAGRDLLL